MTLKSGPCLVFVFAIALGGVAGGQDPAPDETPDTPSFKPPKYQWPLRHDEDWSGLGEVPESAESDSWDPIKYVKLSDDGKIWASFGGSLRLRLESWWNFEFTPSPAGDDTFLLFQALVHGDFHLGDNVRVFLQGKSALATDRTLPGGKRILDVDTIALQQGFVDVRVPLDDEGTSFVVRPGRQMYQFGAERLVSPLQWSNTMRAWDGVTGILEWNDWRIDGFVSYFVPVRKYDYNKPDQDTVFYGVYATGGIGDAGVGTDFYFLGLNKKNARTYNGTTGPEDRYTLGARAFGTVPDTSFDYNVEGAYQFGRVGSANVNAYMFGGQFGYTFGGAWSSPRLFAGLEMGSGDSSPGGDVQTFNQIFPLGHAWLGYADIIGRQNIIAPNLGVKFKPIKKLTIGLNGLYFVRASTSDGLYGVGGGITRSGSLPLVTGQTGLSSARTVGQEIDLTFTYQFDRHTTAELGYSHFFPGDFVKETGPAPDVDFLYLQVQYTF